MFSAKSSYVSATMTELDDIDDSKLAMMVIPMMVTEV
jgi:hypothetical protein